jgi:hypothetical protein
VRQSYCPPVCQPLCIGDHVTAGDYVVHSRFSRAVNFVKQLTKGTPSPLMLSLVTEDVGPGPTNIVVRHLRAFQHASLCILGDCLMIANRTYAFDKIASYDSTFYPDPIPLERLADRLKRFETILLQTAPPKSLAVLLESERQQQFTPGFEQAYLARVRAGIDKILIGDVEQGIGMIRGLGFGLTPSGDDFIVGFLLGLIVIERIDGCDLNALRQRMYDIAVGQNPISNTFLYCAKEGWLFDRWKRVLTTLLSDEDVALDDMVRNLMSVGETSGADTAVGFVVSMKYARGLKREM